MLLPILHSVPANRLVTTVYEMSERAAVGSCINAHVDPNLLSLLAKSVDSRSVVAWIWSAVRDRVAISTEDAKLRSNQLLRLLSVLCGIGWERLQVRYFEIGEARPREFRYNSQRRWPNSTPFVYHRVLRKRF